MQPTIVEHRAFHVVGIRARHRQGGTPEIFAQWQRFSDRAGEIPDAVPDVHYAICADDSRPGDPGFTYLTCAEVTSPGRIPEGMVGLTVAGGRYAMFTVRGPVSALAKTIRTVWKEWLPAAGLEPTGAPDFERYDERFAMERPESEVDLYIPVGAASAPTH